MTEGLQQVSLVAFTLSKKTKSYSRGDVMHMSIIIHTRLGGLAIDVEALSIN